MEKLKDDIDSLRLLKENKNVYGKCFVPQQSLCELLTKPAVRGALESCIPNQLDSLKELHTRASRSEIQRYHLDETVDAIAGRAYKIFAILVLMSKPKFI